MKQIILSLFLVLFLSLSILSAIPFEREKFADTEKMVDKVLNSKLKDLQKFDVKKVVIFECAGEFVVSRETAPSAFEAKDMTMYEIKQHTSTTSVSFNQEFCAEVASGVYDLVKETLEKSGIAVIPTEEWMKDPTYQEIEKKLVAYDEDKAAKYGMFSKTVTTRTIKVAAAGMRMYPDNALSQLSLMKSMQKKGKILEDTGSQAFVSIKFTIDKGVKAAPVITNFTVNFETGFKKSDMGGGNYMYSPSAFDFMALKVPIESRDNVLSTGNTKYLDTSLYNKAVFDVLDVLETMMDYKLKEETSKYIK